MLQCIKLRFHLWYLSAWSFREIYSYCSIFIWAKRFVSLSSSINHVFRVCLTLNGYGHEYFEKQGKFIGISKCIDKSDSFYNASYSSMILSHQYSYYYFFVRIGRKKLWFDPKAKQISQTNGQFLSSYITHLCDSITMNLLFC